MRWLLSIAFLAHAPVSALADDAKPVRSPPARKSMGTWDCNGSKPQEVTLAPGENLYEWRGECSSAEGVGLVIEPTSADLRPSAITDDKAKRLYGTIVNTGPRAVKVRVYVFVGFA